MRVCVCVCVRARMFVCVLACVRKNNLMLSLASSVPGHKAKQSEVLIDLAGLEPQGPAAATSSHLQAPPSSLSVPADLLCGAAVAPGPQGSFTATSLTLLDEELLFLGEDLRTPTG